MKIKIEVNLKCNRCNFPLGNWGPDNGTILCLSCGNEYIYDNGILDCIKHGEINNPLYQDDELSSFASDNEMDEFTDYYKYIIKMICPNITVMDN